MSVQLIYRDSGAPAITPARTGIIYVDTSNNRVYLSTDTSSSADWKILPENISELLVDADVDFGGNYKAINLKGIDFQTFTEYTISGGVIAPVQSLASIDTEGDASADDIDTITVATDLNVIFLKMENSGRVPTLKHGTGNLSLPNATDLAMVADVVYMMIYNGSNWLLAFDPSGTGTTFPIADGTALLKGSIDATKKARFEVDTNTPTATTIVISTPSNDFDMEEAVRNSGSGTNNAIPRFNVSGTHIQNSGVIIDDSNNLSGVAKISTSDHLEVTEIAAPSTPATGKVAVYAKTDGKLYIKDDTGTETDLTSGGSSLPVDDATSIAQGSVDNTKQVRFECDTNVPTSTTVVLTAPSADMDLDEVDANVDDLVTLSGVAENSTDLGTFTGTTIADNETVKGALQDLEDAVETKANLNINTASYGSAQTLTTTECKGYVIYVTGAATITLPAIASGMSVTIITIGNIAVSVDPNASDLIYLDGVALDDGDKITNGSVSGDIAVLTYYSADGWYASTNGWTDGGA